MNMIRTKNQYDSRITNIEIDVTNDCVMQCDYCFRGESEKRYLDYEIGCKAIDFLIKESKNLKDISVSFWGGEPLMAFDLIKNLVRYGERKAHFFGKTIRFNSPTNLVLVTDEVIRFYKRHNISILSSLDGAPESHDKHRIFPSGKGSSTTVFKNVPKVLNYNNYAAARCTISNDTAHRLHEDIIYLHQNLGFKRIWYYLVPEIEWSQKQCSDLERELRRLSDYVISCFRINDFIQVKPLFNAIKSILEPIRPKYHCGAGRRSVSITIDGQICPCHRFPGIDKEGMWNLGTLWEGFDHKKREKLQAIDGRYDTVADCENCIAVNYCGIGCIAANLTTTNNICKPNKYICYFSRLQVKEAARIHFILQRENNKMYDDFFLKNKRFSYTSEQESLGCQINNLHEKNGANSPSAYKADNSICGCCCI